MTTRRGVGRLTSANPASAKMPRLPTYSSPQLNSWPGWVPAKSRWCVGAGVSGLYSAWRLLAHDGKQRITVFEGSKRTGGRLVSVTLER